MNITEITVATSNVPAFHKAVKSVNRIAEKHGLGNVSIFGESAPFMVQKDGKVHEFITFKLSTPAPIVAPGSWSFVASRSVTEQGIETIVPDSKNRPIAKRYTGNLNCDACEANRKRVKTFIIADDKGNAIEVGRECAHQFIGNVEAKMHAFNLAEALDSLVHGQGWNAPGAAIEAWDIETAMNAIYGVWSVGGFVKSFDGFSANMSATWRIAREKISSPVTDEAKEATGNVIAWVNALPEGNDFTDTLKDIISSGFVSIRRLPILAYVFEAHRKDMQKKAEASIPKVPLVAGRQVLEGVMLSFKWVSSAFGPDVMKMIVRLTTGSKVYVTVPAGITFVEGGTIKFKATVEVSPNDPCFGFATRPSLKV